MIPFFLFNSFMYLTLLFIGKVLESGLYSLEHFYQQANLPRLNKESHGDLIIVVFQIFFRNTNKCFKPKHEI